MKQFKINEFEKVGSEDFNDIQLAIHQSIYEKTLYPLFKKQNGFVGDGFKVDRDNLLNVTVKAGRGFMFDGSQVGNESKYRALQLVEDLNLTVGIGIWPVEPVANKRIDILVVRPHREVTLQSERFIRTGGIGPVVAQSVDKIIEDLYEIDVVTGVVDVAPSAPATPSGWLKIAEVELNSTGIVDGSKVTDTRQLLTPASESRPTESRFVSPSGLGSDTTLQSAITNLPAGGGTIFLMEDITIDALHSLPARSVIRGLSRAVSIEITDSGQIELADDCIIENLTIETNETAIVGLIDCVGNRTQVRNVKFSPPVAGLNTCVLLTGDSNEIVACDFLECDDTGTNMSFSVAGNLNTYAGKASLQASFQRVIALTASDSPFNIKAIHSGAVFLMDTTTGPIDIELPAPCNGLVFTLKDTAGNLSNEAVTLIAPVGVDLAGIDDEYVLESNFGCWEVLCSETEFVIL